MAQPEIFGLSDKGMKRETNQDAFRIHTPPNEELALLRGTLLLVADGMGGHRGGETASAMAADIVLRAYFSAPANLSNREALKAAVEQANQVVYEEAQRRPDLQGMGTTLTAAVILRDYIIVCQVGDSRAYILRGNRLALITRDQSMVWGFLERRDITYDQLRTHPNRNVVSHALGINPTIEPIFTEGQLEKGDMLMLCSDGLWEEILDPDIGSAMAIPSPLQSTVHRLVTRANANGGRDNITVILAKPDVRRRGPATRPLPFVLSWPLAGEKLPRPAKSRLVPVVVLCVLAFVALAVILILSLTRPSVSIAEVNIKVDKGCMISIQDAELPETNTTFALVPGTPKEVTVWLNRATYTAIPVNDDYSAIVTGTFREETLTILIPRYVADDVQITITSTGPDGKPLSLAGKSLFLQNGMGQEVKLPITSRGEGASDLASGGLDAGAWKFAGIGQEAQVSVTPSAFEILFKEKNNETKSVLEVSRPQPGETSTRYGLLTIKAKQGRLSVLCNVNPALITVWGTKVDGSSVADFPYRESVDLDPGDYHIKVEAAGYEPQEQKTTITAAAESSLEFRFNLAPIFFSPTIPPQTEMSPPTELENLQAGLDTLKADKEALQTELKNLRAKHNSSPADYARISEIEQKSLPEIQKQIDALTERINNSGDN